MEIEIESTNEQTYTLNMANSRKLVNWLSELQSSITLTTHQANKIIFISPLKSPEKGLSLLSRSIPACRGIAISPKGFYTYSYHQIFHYCFEFNDKDNSAEHDVTYIPDINLISNELAIEELKVSKKEQIYCVSSTNNTLLKIIQNNFIKIWAYDKKDYYISGFAMYNDSPKYVTAFNRTNGSGIVIDIETNINICHNLSMPHSPHWYQDKLWLLNSGTGHFGYIQDSKFVPITFCPGFIRGISFIKNYALVGLSSVSQAHLGDPIQLKINLEQNHVSSRSGIYIIHLYTGQIVHWIQFKGWLKEVYDVALFPGINNPIALSLEANKIKNNLDVHLLKLIQ